MSELVYPEKTIEHRFYTTLSEAISEEIDTEVMKEMGFSITKEVINTPSRKLPGLWNSDLTKYVDQVDKKTFRIPYNHDSLNWVRGNCAWKFYDYSDAEGDHRIEFYEETDAVLFKLMWVAL